MKKKLLTALVLLLGLTAAACGFRASPSIESMEAPPGIAMGGEMVEADSRGFAEQSFDSDASLMDEGSLTERMVTRNANLTVVVTDPVASIDEISDMAKDMEGYVVSSNVYVATYGEAQVRAQSASITIRVPSDRLDEALELIKADAVEVRNEYVSGQDITQEFIDNQSRLRNLEAAEEQLLSILEMATDTEDVLNVFNELTRIRGEIEVIQGRLQYLQQSADTSSISVELIPDVATQPIEIERWQLRATFNKAVEALVATAEFLVNALIWIAIYVLPLGLVIGLVVWLVARAVRKRKAKAK
jgi:hypothetical protein